MRGQLPFLPLRVRMLFNGGTSLTLVLVGLHLIASLIFIFRLQSLRELEECFPCFLLSKLNISHSINSPNLMISWILFVYVLVR